MFADWREFELDEIPEWSPTAQKVFLFIFAVVMIATSLFFFVMPLNEKIDNASRQENILRGQFRSKAEQVASLPNVDEQMQALNQFYQRLKAQLPEEEELAILLAGINDTGVQHALKFKQLRWGEGEQKGWLYQVPLKMGIEGTYENIGLFSSALSRLPRIVALQNLNLKRVKNQNTLSLSVTAHTYRFIDVKGDE